MSHTAIIKTGGNGQRRALRREVRFRTHGASLGLTTTRTEELIRHVEHGLKFKTLESFAAQSGVALATLASILDIPQRTLARRKAAGRLAPAESERLFRLSSIFEKAVELFEGNVPEAVIWLTRPKTALGHETPLRYSRTDLGAREVENLMARLEHGVFA